jgi:hypothetical protein
MPRACSIDAVLGKMSARPCAARTRVLCSFARVHVCCACALRALNAACPSLRQALWAESPQGLYPNPNCGMDPEEAAVYFEFFGIVLGKLIFESFLVRARVRA